MQKNATMQIATSGAEGEGGRATRGRSRPAKTHTKTDSLSEGAFAERVAQQPPVHEVVRHVRALPLHRSTVRQTRRSLRAADSGAPFARPPGSVWGGGARGERAARGGGTGAAAAGGRRRRRPRDQSTIDYAAPRATLAHAPRWSFVGFRNGNELFGQFIMAAI